MSVFFETKQTVIQFTPVAKQKGFFYEMQFGFQESMGCIEASFRISETICLNGRVKFSVAFLTA